MYYAYVKVIPLFCLLTHVATTIFFKKTCICVLDSTKNLSYAVDMTKCNTHGCYSIWLPWEQWEDCLADCGSGTQVRHRKCEVPHPSIQTCGGSSLDTQTCERVPCNTEGK